jgi:branched-chain amino acid transport system substrate-binding protein
MNVKIMSLQKECLLKNKLLKMEEYMKAKHVVLAALIVLISGMPLFAGGGSETQQKKDSPIIIGVSTPLTGDNAEYGEFFRKGAMLAVKLINDKGGINGIPIEFVIEDSKSDPKEAVLIAQRFISNPDVVAVVGDFNSSASMAAAQIYSPAGLVLISPTASHPDFTKIGEYIFRAGTTQLYEATFLARWTVKQLGRKRIAVIYVNNDWGVSTQENYVKTAKEEGAEIVAFEHFIPGDKDFTASLTKIKNANPDVFFIATQWADAALIATQAQKLGLKVDLIGSGTLATKTLIESAGTAVEGIRANTQYFPGDPRPSSKYYNEEFVKMFGMQPPHSHCALTYDSFMLLAEAIKKGGRDRAKIRDALATIKDFPGATGILTIDKDRNPYKEFAKIQVIDQKWQISPDK